MQVQECLEAAGFSRSNPYNIVVQGKITKMSLMSDMERLTMLKEVGGARLYELKRTEAMKGMEENKVACQQLDEMVRFRGSQPVLTFQPKYHIF